VDYELPLGSSNIFYYTLNITTAKETLQKKAILTKTGLRAEERRRVSNTTHRYISLSNNQTHYTLWEKLKHKYYSL